MQSYKHTHPHSKLRTPQSVALYLQSFMSQGHKADHYSFETGSTTRSLNPWLLTYIPLIINIGHKTSCLYLFICFLFFVFLSSHCAVNHRNLNNSLHTPETTFLNRESKKDTRETPATGQQFDSCTNQTLFLGGLPYDCSCICFVHRNDT